jgi:hypothetical protein
MLHRASDMDSLERPRQRKIDMRFGTWKVRSLYRAEDLQVDDKIILEWILGKCNGKVWTGCVWSRTGSSDGPL